MQIEICTDSVESALAAHAGQAVRVELCSALSEGGLTPSSGLIRKVRDTVPIQLFVMIRPRGGNFIYSESEYSVMQHDIANAKDLGCDGVVLGILTPGGDVDLERTRSLVELARPMGVTFHRAFDKARDLESALEEVISSGADRILTSGGTSSAYAGAQTLARLQTLARGRIQLMAGGGVRKENVSEILRISRVHAVHSSLRGVPGQRDEAGAQAKGWPRVRVKDVADLRRQANASINSDGILVR